MNIREIDEGYPISYLKFTRRELANKIKASDKPPSDRDIEQLANIQTAIRALEDVRNEVYKEETGKNFTE